MSLDHLTKPFPYQREGIDAIKALGGHCLLADEMGLGKTLQGLRWVREGHLVPALVVCPAFLKENWKREARQHIRTDALVLSGRQGFDLRTLDKVPKLVIINYDVVKHWGRFLYWFGFQAILLDECQYIKDMASIRTKRIKKLAETIPNKLAISGTPATNRPIELYPVLNMLRPDIWNNYYQFGHNFCDPTMERGRWVFKGASNREELNKQLRTHVMIRRRKADVLKDLPKMSMHVVPFKPNLDMYHKIESEFEEWTKKYKPKNETKEKVQHSKIRKLLQSVVKARLDDSIEWVTNWLSGCDEKIILFVIHRAVVNRLHKQFPNSVVINGTKTMKERTASIDQFTNDPNTRTMIGNIQAAGVGTNLVAASTVAFLELSWVPGHHLQAIKRVDRIGQTMPVNAYFHLVPGTIEERIMRRIETKQKDLNMIYDGDEDSIELNIMDKLISYYRRPDKCRKKKRA